MKVINSKTKKGGNILPPDQSMKISKKIRETSPSK